MIKARLKYSNKQPNGKLTLIKIGLATGVHRNQQRHSECIIHQAGGDKRRLEEEQTLEEEEEMMEHKMK